MKCNNSSCSYQNVYTGHCELEKDEIDSCPSIKMRKKLTEFHAGQE